MTGAIPEPQFPSLIPVFSEMRTERIALRPHTPDDFEPLWEALQESRDRIRPWLPFADQSPEQLRDWLAHVAARWLTREGLGMGMWELETGRLVGNIGLIVHSWKIRSFEIGYWLRTSAEGRGYMTEATRALTDFAFDHLDANRVQIRCDAENSRSAAVPQRLGFRQEALMRRDYARPNGELGDTLVFGLIRDDPRWPDRVDRPETSAHG